MNRGLSPTASFAIPFALHTLGCVACILGQQAWTGAWVAAAERHFDDLMIVHTLPRTEQEIAKFHERSKAQACELVPANEPLEITGFMHCLTDRDRREWERGIALLPSSRRHVLTIGLDMRSEDQARLPTVSGGQILRYLQNHFVTIQARVQKDPLTGELFLHHQPLAATASFGRGSLTKDFTEATAEAVREFRSLGLFLASGEKKTAQHLRTLVLTYRSVEVLPRVAEGQSRLRSKYEFVFLRAREASQDGKPQLTIAAFATSDQRQRLHLLESWSLPSHTRQCAVHAQVLFTEYSTFGLIPTQSATRDVAYRSRSSYTWEELEDYARAHNWRGSAWENLGRTLDQVLDGRVVPVR